MEDQDISIDLVVNDGSELSEEVSSPRKGYFYGKMPLIGKLSYFIFLATVLLLPLFILPASWGLQLEFIKKFLFTAGILSSFTLWLVTRLEDGVIEFPSGAVFWSSLLVLVSFLVSSLVSTSVGNSLFGLGFENDTFISAVIFFISLFLASTFFESEKQLYQLFRGLLVSGSLVFFVELLQLFSPIKVLSGGVLNNMIGKWNDLGIFFGLALLVSVIALEFPFYYDGRLKKFFWLLFFGSAIIVACVNYNLIWAIIGGFSLIIFLYSLSNSGLFSNDSSERWSFMNVVFRPSLLLILLSIILFVSSSSVGSVLGKYGLFQLEVRPSWQSTIDVARSTMSKNLYFGTGPNTFSTAWAAAKPDAVNSTVFWNTDFNVGFGRIPSFGITLGMFGLISAGLFMLSLIYFGFRALLASFDDLADHFTVLTAVVASFYLWTFSMFYVTDTVLLGLTFVFTGVLLMMLSRAGLTKSYEFSFLNSPRLGFISVFIIVVLIIAVVSGGYTMARKFAAVYKFQTGLNEYTSSGNLDHALLSVSGAINLDEQDLYCRSLAEVYILRLKNLMSTGNNLSKDALMSQLQSNLSAAAGSAKKATEINSGNYLNWVELGKVGETVTPLKNVIAGTYDLAISSYNKALVLNSKNPDIYLSLGRVEYANGNIGKAKDYISQALNIKSNYTDALFLLSQIEAGQGNLAVAISQAQQAAVFSPGDVGILFQIGLLKYMNKDYSGSIDALKHATDLQGNYSNAKYFLGLSYSKLGKITEAIHEFEDVLTLNPENQEVKNILKNLRAGRTALDNIVPPVNEPLAPEKRSNPPLKDSTPQAVN